MHTGTSRLPLWWKKTSHIIIKHQFDPWHMAKSLRKDLVAVWKEKEGEDLVLWISNSSIVNYLWITFLLREVELYCVSCCRNPWMAWVSVLFSLWAWCADSWVAKERGVVRIGSPALNALKEIACKPKFLTDVLLLAEFIRSGVKRFSMAPWQRNASQNCSTSHTMEWNSALSSPSSTTIGMQGEKSKLPPLVLGKHDLNVSSPSYKKSG